MPGWFCLQQTPGTRARYALTQDAAPAQRRKHHCSPEITTDLGAPAHRSCVAVGLAHSLGLGSRALCSAKQIEDDLWRCFARSAPLALQLPVSNIDLSCDKVI